MNFWLIENLCMEPPSYLCIEEKINVEQLVWRKSGQIYQLVENLFGMIASERSLN